MTTYEIEDDTDEVVEINSEDELDDQMTED